jgi:thiol-disulfide isomerase/thioredoxin
MRRQHALLVLLIAGLLTLTACATGQQPGPAHAASAAPPTASPAAATSSPATRSGASAAAPGPVTVPATLRFTATTVDGARFDAATLAGKPAVLWFWAPWCPTCAGEAPQVARLAARYAGKVTVVGVAGLDKQPAMREFVTRMHTSGFVNLADETGVVWRRFGITAQATYVLLDAAGQVLYTGYLDDSQLAARLANLAG